MMYMATSRRDDLISLVYNLISLLNNGELYTKEQINDSDPFDQILKLK
jgi:hypothetical protein